MAERAARRAVVRRGLALGALVAGVVALALVLLRGDGDYTVRAQFLNAGQLVKGNVVEVAGTRIGLVQELRLTDDGRAEVVMRIDDERYRPLHRGTTMSIRQVGLSGVANRYVDVTPGDERQAEIEDGGILGTTETRGIVDIDMVLNAFDADARADVRSILTEGAKGLDGTTASVNRLLGYLNPAVAQTRALVEDVTRDQAAVDTLIRAGATTAGTLAGRRDDIEDGIVSSAATLEALASERDALQRSLSRAPGVLRQGSGTLDEVRDTLRVVRPALREAQPVAPRLATVLRRLLPVSRAARPVLADVRELIAPLRKTLRALPALQAAALPALRSATSAIRSAQPIFTGLRPYTQDLLGGLGALGRIGSSYDANGHYLRVSGNGNPTTSAAGLGEIVPNVQLPMLTNSITGQTGRCPGGAASARAKDGSNPFVPDPSICDEKKGGG